MQGHWVHEQAYYRRRFPDQFALANRIHHPRDVYLRESWVITPLDDWLAKVFLPRRLDDTIDLMATAAAPARETTAIAAARQVIADCDAKLATHRATLEAGADPAVTQWIAEAQARRARVEAELRASPKEAGTRMSRDEIARLVRSIKDLAAVVRQAEPQDHAEIHRQLGVRLTYGSGKHKVLAEMRLNQHSRDTRGLSVRVRGGIWTNTPRLTPLTTVLALA
ncbi:MULTISPECIES: hypothetical protein [Streptomyces]|uniref:Transposase n=1 Tax=Streptomyces mordarskii TaxID=1226758 RepID=A0ABN1CPS0_9ACTN|nr:hypothetical protein [Streptomyces antimycoticus]